MAAKQLEGGQKVPLLRTEREVFWGRTGGMSLERKNPLESFPKNTKEKQRERSTSEVRKLSASRGRQFANENLRVGGRGKGGRTASRKILEI